MLRRAPVVADKYHNTVTLRSTVKPIEKESPFFGTAGEVRAIYKDILFLFFRKAENLHLLRESNGFSAVKAHNVVNSGFELIDQAHRSQMNTQGFQQAKLDRRIKDRKMIN